VGGAIHELAPHDLVRVPPMTWHQFRATGGEPLGFLCLVRRERDKPQRPTAGDLAALRADPAVGAFIRH
jgi:mannose-6-phosphate isomerase-like protein (cupin superfamily)